MKKHTPETSKKQIEQETMRLIASRGMSNFSFPKLTAATGISAPTIYEFYENKKDLLTVCFLKADEKIGRLLADAMEKDLPHREQTADVKNYCWLLWSAYWQFLMENPDRTMFYKAFCYSEYYTDAIIQKRDEHYRQFMQYIDAIGGRFHLSERCSCRVLIIHLIDGTMSAAVKFFRGEFKNDEMTINTIYHAIFQPVFSILELRT